MLEVVNDALLKAAIDAYIRLLSLGNYPGRQTPKGQAELAALVEAITAEIRIHAADWDEERVQTYCEGRAGDMASVTTK